MNASIYFSINLFNTVLCLIINAIPYKLTFIKSYLYTMHLLHHVTGNCEHVTDNVKPSDLIRIPRVVSLSCYCRSLEKLFTETMFGFCMQVQTLRSI